MAATETKCERELHLELIGKSLGGLRSGLEGVAYDPALVDTVVEELNRLAAELRLASLQDRGNLSQTDVLKALLSDSNAPLSVNDIATRTGFPSSGVRALLYTNRQCFASSKMSPRHVVWSLNRGAKRECSR